MKPSELPELGLAAVACDTETSGLYVDDGARVAVVSLAWIGDDDQVVAHAFPFDQGVRDKRPQQALDFGDDPNLDESEWVALLDWLERHRLVMHNAKFDCMLLRAGTRHWAGRDLMSSVVWDTMLVNKEIWPTRPTALKTTGTRLQLTGGDEDAEKAELSKALKQAKLTGKNRRYDLLAWNQIEQYAETDALLTILLYCVQQEMVYDYQVVPLWWVTREMAVCRLLYEIEKRGIPFDAADCLESAGLLQDEKDSINTQLPFPASLKGAKQYFFTTLGLVPYSVTKKGAPQLAADDVMKLERDGHPYAAEYAHWRKLETALNMWYLAYPGFIGEDGRLRTCYRQTKEEGRDGGGAVSGRFSVERVNLQAIPHKSKLTLPAGAKTPREFIRPEPGMRLWELDLRQAELRVAAVMAGCDPMLELIEQEADMHGETAAALFNTDSSDPEWFKYRQIAKRCNFSLIFGVGPDKLRFTIYKESGIELGRNETEQIVDGWRQLYPQFPRQLRIEDRRADRLGYVELINGRRRSFFPGEETHKAFNQRVQGSLAEFAKEWALETEQGWPGALILLIHDSEVLELPEDDETTCPGVAKVGGELGTSWFEVPMGVDYGEWGEH